MTQEQFGIWFVRNHPRFLRFANKILRNRESAEDAVQKAAALAWSNLNNLQESHLLDSWFYTILHRVCLRLRSDERTDIPLDQMEDWQNDGLMAKKLQDEGISKDLAAALESCWQELPTQQKLILELKAEGESNEDIADQLEVALQPLRYQINVAYKSLRSCLAAKGYNQAPQIVPTLCHPPKNLPL
ncbi:MAG: sigma-70 family RNA polymerase sigma factor [Fimbriimonadaceae bacterium]|jgi:RNA polymerase sigma factor (sigma-70 family)|nr:sigma-70 family RNA polymerase sigma factor [Fimbriimonadaceae bacterium]